MTNREINARFYADILKKLQDIYGDRLTPEFVETYPLGLVADISEILGGEEFEAIRVFYHIFQE